MPGPPPEHPHLRLLKGNPGKRRVRIPPEDVDIRTPHLRIGKTAAGGDLPVPLSHRFLELPPPRQRLAADDLVAALDAKQGMSHLLRLPVQSVQTSHRYDCGGPWRTRFVSR